MSDYFSVLKGTVDNLRPNTRDTRRAIYDRARNALLDRLSGQEPRLPKRLIESEQAALEAAIGRVEDGYAARARPRAPEVPPAIASVLSQNRGPRPASQAPAVAAPVPEVEPEYARSVRIPTDRPIGLYAGLAAVAILLIGGAAYMFWPKASFEERAAASAGAGAPAGGTASKPAWADAGVNYVYLRQPVYYRTTHPVGTIVVDKAQRLLYVVRPNVVAIRYGIGVGPECVTAAGLYRIARKEEWPGLKDPKADERAANPLGARALYLDQSYRLHGTNAPNTIGSTVSLGCFRLTNDDITEIYQQAPVDTRVIVTD
jgi:lipoprotein-anchoring transpeptidase ErfK/SrfK